jgi:hypothetical protein
MTTSLESWLDDFADELGIGSVTSEEADKLLDIAGMAAHSTERKAAPLTCWLIGKSGKSVEEAYNIAKSLEKKYTEE